MYLRLLGVTAGGVGLGLLALGRLASRDRKRIALALLLVNMEAVGLYFASFIHGSPNWGGAVVLVLHAIPFLGIVAAVVRERGEKLQSVSRLLLASCAAISNRFRTSG